MVDECRLKETHSSAPLVESARGPVYRHARAGLRREPVLDGSQIPKEDQLKDPYSKRSTLREALKERHSKGDNRRETLHKRGARRETLEEKRSKRDAQRETRVAFLTALSLFNSSRDTKTGHSKTFF
jgi:hypothetical protein